MTRSCECDLCLGETLFVHPQQFQILGHEGAESALQKSKGSFDKEKSSLDCCEETELCDSPISRGLHKNNGDQGRVLTLLASCVVKRSSRIWKKRSGHTKGGKRIELEVVTIQCQSLFPHQAEAGAVVFGCMCWCTKDQRKQSMSPRRDN